jgi:hypothetical protein
MALARLSLLNLTWLGSVDATGVSRKQSIAKEGQMQGRRLISNYYVGMMLGLVGWSSLSSLCFQALLGFVSQWRYLYASSLLSAPAAGSDLCGITPSVGKLTRMSGGRLPFIFTNNVWARGSSERKKESTLKACPARSTQRPRPRDGALRRSSKLEQ